MRELDVSLGAISWIITVFLLVGAGTVALAGRLADIYGRRRVMLILMVISTIGPIISATTGTFEGILIGRALQGTSAALFPLLVALAREVVTEKRAPVLISVTSGSQVIAGSFGGLLAGVVIDAGNWRLLFLASGLLAAVALIAAAIILPKPTEKLHASQTKLDWLGAVLPIPAIAAILYCIEQSRHGINTTNIAIFVVGLSIAAFWIVRELKISEPMFNLRLFKQRSLALIALSISVLLTGLLVGGPLLQQLLLQGSVDLPIGLGLSPTEAGYVGLATGIVAFALSPLPGKISARSNSRTPLLIGIVVGIGGCGTLALSTSSLPVAIIALAIIGVSTTFCLASIPNLILESVPFENTGEAVGMIYGPIRSLASAIGTTIITTLLATRTVPGTNSPTEYSWNLALGWMVITAIAGGIAAFAIRPRNSAPESVQADSPTSRLKGDSNLMS